MSSRDVPAVLHWWKLLEIHPLGLTGDLPCKYGAVVDRLGLTQRNILVMRWPQATGRSMALLLSPGEPRRSWFHWRARTGEAASTAYPGSSLNHKVGSGDAVHTRNLATEKLPMFLKQGARKWAKGTASCSVSLVPSTVKVKHVHFHRVDKHDFRPEMQPEKFKKVHFTMPVYWEFQKLQDCCMLESMSYPKNICTPKENLWFPKHTAI